MCRTTHQHNIVTSRSKLLYTWTPWPTQGVMHVQEEGRRQFNRHSSEWMLQENLRTRRVRPMGIPCLRQRSIKSQACKPNSTLPRACLFELQSVVAIFRRTRPADICQWPSVKHKDQARQNVTSVLSDRALSAGALVLTASSFSTGLCPKWLPTPRSRVWSGDWVWSGDCPSLWVGPGPASTARTVWAQIQSYRGSMGQLFMPGLKVMLAGLHTAEFK